MQSERHANKTTDQLYSDLESMGVNVHELRGYSLSDGALVQLVAGLERLIRDYEHRHPGATVKP